MRSFVVASAVSVFIGCADGTVAAPAAHHPASTEAQEGVTHVATAATSPPAPSPTGSVDHSHHQHGTAPAGSTKTIYACPMHPEVTSDKPGQCPKCGMNLVPKKDAP